MAVKQYKKNCQVFRVQESRIKKIMNKINEIDGMMEKARFAEELQNEIAVLLFCPDKVARKAECKNCQFIANLRKKTVDLIIVVDKLR
jgi:hypothetical protein